MRKTMLLFVLMVVAAFIVISGCKKNTSPAAPANTPNATQTVIAAAKATQTEVAALVNVPGGTFTQSDGYASFSHTISAFKLGKYEVTYGLWYTVYQWGISNGYSFANAGVEGSNGTIGASPTSAKCQPVNVINWRDMIVWCNAYSQMTGLTPVYCSDIGFTIPIKDSTDGSFGSSINTAAGSFDNPYVNWNATGYRLPTEGEWQYAASFIDGSNWTPSGYASGATGDTSNAVATGTVAWYDANSGYVTHDVGGKTANALGIYDMSGNVGEWCWDWYAIYPTVTSSDYRGPASGSCRTYRGGDVVTSAVGMYLGLRFPSINPYSEFYDLGFRFARTN